VQLDSSHVETLLTIVAINDRFADGSDISWLWDVDFELLGAGSGSQPESAENGEPHRIVCTGVRAQDVALRFKYASVPDNVVQAEPDEGRAVHMGLEAARQGSHVTVFASYTAMLDIRQRLQRMHLVQPFWTD
jgi:UDP-N-acetylmuramyl tripeptide synthase